MGRRAACMGKSASRLSIPGSLPFDPFVGSQTSSGRGEKGTLVVLQRQRTKGKRSQHANPPPPRLWHATTDVLLGRTRFRCLGIAEVSRATGHPGWGHLYSLGFVFLLEMVLLCYVCRCAAVVASSPLRLRANGLCFASSA